jgi:acyl-CoA thioesterase I
LGNTGTKRRSRLRRGFASAALLLALGTAGLRAADAPGEKTIVFFGDSLTAGYGLADPDTEAFPAQVQKRIDAEQLPWRTVNAGLSGETSAGGLRRVDWVLNQRPDIFVLELGANDGLRGISPGVTQANLQAIIERVRTRYPETRIVLAGMRMPPNMGADFTEAFDAIFPALARKNGTVLIPFLLAGVATVANLNQGDGIHPTAAGATVVADVVWKVIRPVVAELK